MEDPGADHWKQKTGKQGDHLMVQQFPFRIFSQPRLGCLCLWGLSLSSFSLALLRRPIEGGIVSVDRILETYRLCGAVPVPVARSDLGIYVMARARTMAA
jgi:hypothetical protein